MIELLLMFSLGAGLGGYLGYSNSEISCVDNQLITESCPVTTAPEDRSFGATTLKLLEVQKQYKKCRAACIPMEIEGVKNAN